MAGFLNIKDYELYDFLMDNSFREGVENPDGESSHEWYLTLEAYPEKKPLAEKAKMIILSGQYRDLRFSKPETRLLWNEIRRDTFATEFALEEKVERNSKKSWHWLIQAAVIIIPLLSAFLLLYFLQDTPSTVEEATIDHVVKQTQNGQKLLITFSDGTQVKLNAGSKLTYDHPFAPEKREVYLEGEAFFEVSPDPDRPFIVRTGNISTKVLGTSFNVRTYPDEESIEVAVVSGKVMVANNDTTDKNTVVLQPAEMATYDKRSQITKVESVNIERVTAWNHDILVFDDADFEEVMDQLEYWYGVEFKILRNEPIKKGFDGSFQHKSLEHVLEGISYTSDFQYEIKGDTVFIR